VRTSAGNKVPNGVVIVNAKAFPWIFAMQTNARHGPESRNMDLEKKQGL
jgi:hypothetical protein